MAMLRRGRYKLNYSLDDPPELYDLEADPGEFHDLGSDPDHAPILDRMREDLLSHWDPLNLERRVRQSQEERVLIRAAETGETPQAVQQKWYAPGGTIGQAKHQ